MASGLVIEGRCGGQRRRTAGSGVWLGGQARGKVGMRATPARGLGSGSTVHAAQGGSMQVEAVPA